MGHGHDHHDILGDLAQHMRPILENSPEGIYLWLDDDHMACNEPLARLFGYTAADWAKTGDFLGTFVDPKDQKMYAEHYARAVGHMQGPSRFRFKGRKRDGSTFNAETDMIPLAYDGHVVAYHFVRAV